MSDSTSFSEDPLRRQSVAIGKTNPYSRRKSMYLRVSQPLPTSKQRLLKASDGPEESIEAKPKVRYENTYKMVPDESTTFSPSKVQKEMREVLSQNLEGVEYDPEVCASLACELAMSIKDRVKTLNFPRYRIISNVVIAPFAEQGFKTASRCVWNDKTDNFACECFKNKSLFAIAMVHGIYAE